MIKLTWTKGIKSLDPLNEHGKYKDVKAYYLICDELRDFDIDTSFIEDGGFYLSGRYGVAFQSIDECKSYIINKIREEIYKKIKEYTELLESLKDENIR